MCNAINRGPLPPRSFFFQLLPSSIKLNPFTNPEASVTPLYEFCKLKPCSHATGMLQPGPHRLKLT
ncbi:hypothetical protein DPMN_107436 [Dreissena polymorpha]|uniref:Uncharacterized protein n=1 Tax=Dreissena polymorpha TaxID=45954 RepID=A0A9D4K758_DREPO|nr:hypothetical protein DPMN_107436 [Dreissena polymorpha]